MFHESYKLLFVDGKKIVVPNLQGFRNLEGFGNLEGFCTKLFWISIMLILYVYFVYPLVLQFLVKYYERPVQCKEITPDVTLLVCAYNEEEVIREKIHNSLELDYPSEKLKIVI